MSLKDHSSKRPADILAMARKGELQRLGIAPLPERKEWVFGQEFPREAFFLSGQPQMLYTGGGQKPWSYTTMGIVLLRI